MDGIVSVMTQTEAHEWKRKVSTQANSLRLLIAEGYEREVWKALGYSDWSECIKAIADEFQLTESYMWKLHIANKTQNNLLLHNCAVDSELIPESQLRPLATLQPADQPRAWELAKATAPNGKITAAHVQAVVDEIKRPAMKTCETCGNSWLADLPSCPYCNLSANARIEGLANNKPHVAHNSGNNEWYTPSEYIEAARSVLGAIDLDPASSVLANETVKATVYLTADDDGLQYSWDGRVWMNPPYSGELIGKFTAKFTEHYSAGDILEGIVLVNNATETAWFQGMLQKAAAVCFTRGRIKFIDMNGVPSGAPLQGQAILYFGDNAEKFASAFWDFGAVLYANR